MGATVKLDSQYASRIGVADESSFYAENASVTEWMLTDEFIYCVLVHYMDPCNKACDAAQLKLQYSRDGGAWTDVASGNDMQPGTGTTLVHGNNVTQRITTNTPSAFCGSGFVAYGLEVEGNTNSNSFSMGSEEWSEVHFAVDPSNAVRGSTYTFRAYNTTEAAALIGTLSASVTTAAGQAQLVEESFTLSDQFDTTVHVKYYESVNESFTLSDQFDTTVHVKYYESVNESFTLTETPYLRGDYKYTVSESVTLGDVLATLAARNTSIDESFTLSDVARLGIKALVEEALTFGDTQDFQIARKLSASDSFTLGEFLAAETAYDKINATEEDLTDWTQEGLPTFFTQEQDAQTASLQDTLTFGEQFAFVAAGAVEDELTFTDEFIVEKSATLLVEESLTLLDSMQADLTAGAYPTDSLTLNELLVTKAALKAAQSESITLAELYEAIRAVQESSSDSLTVADQFGLQAHLSVSISDALTLAESYDAIKATQQAISDTLTLTEDLQPIAHKASDLSDSLTIDEVLYPRIARNVDVDETLTVSDEMSARADKLASISDSLTLDDLLRVGSFALINDALSFGEQNYFIHYQKHAYADSIVFVDSYFVAQKYLYAYFDSVSFGSNLLTRVGMKVYETLTLTEDLQPLGRFFRDVSDNLSITDYTVLYHTIAIGSVIGLQDSYVLKTSKSITLVDNLNLDEAPGALGRYSITIGDSNAVQEDDAINWTQENTDNFTQEGDKDLVFKDYFSTKILYSILSDGLSLTDNFYAQVYSMPCPPATGPCSTPATDLPEEVKTLAVLTPLLGNVSIQFVPYYLYVTWDVSASLPNQYVRMFYRRQGIEERFSTIQVDRDTGAIMTPPNLESDTTYEVLIRLETDTQYSDWIINGVVAPPLQGNLTFTDEFVLS